MNELAPRARRALVGLIVLGIAFIAAPFAFQMFDRAPQGADMLANFKPFMTAQRLDGFQQDIATIDKAVNEVDTVGAKQLGPLSKATPSYTPLSKQWPEINTTMTDLLDQVQADRTNYDAVAGLPSFRLFPWFFVVPGALVAILAALALTRRISVQGVRAVVIVIGLGLAVAPLAFGMFWRAPKGGEMMKTFETIETAQNVARIQGYFSTMATGQGAIRLEVIPALEHSGWSPAQIADNLPAMTTLNRDWVHILNDMTPMIGAMSDGVPQYQAISALPPFPLFPWFFLAPGVLAAAIAGFGLRRVPTPVPVQGAS
ncbi:MAG: hypothetical protein JWQ70_3099 [Aeromicrobium sp.]|nr:hypothetical protein [Aeromicrobium sp.]